MAEHEAHNPLEADLPTMLGSPTLHTLDAYRQAIDLPYLKDGQDKYLGHLIIDGKTAAQELLELAQNSDTEDAKLLLQRVRLGEDAEEALAAHFLPLVVGMARNFAYTKDEILELVAVGNVALIEGVKEYKPREDAGFAGFATVVARNAMSEFVTRERQKRTGLTRSMLDMLRDIELAHKAALDAGDTLNYMEIADFLGYEEAAVYEALRLRNIRTVSLDLPLIQDQQTTLADILEDPTAPDDIEDVTNKILLEKIWGVAKELRDKELMNEKEWFVFVGRFRDDLSQRVIGEALGIAQTAVSDWEEKVIAKIKYAINHPHSLVLPEVTEPHQVEKPIHLLALLGIAVPRNVDPRPLALQVIEAARLTETQRLTLLKLLGTNDQPTLPISVVAKELGVSFGSVCQTRDRAIRIIIAEQSRDDIQELADRLVDFGLPIPEGDDLKAATYTMIETSQATELQRMVLHKLLGTIDEPLTVAELARELGINWPSVRKSRDRGVTRILKTLNDTAENYKASRI